MENESFDYDFEGAQMQPANVLNPLASYKTPVPHMAAPRAKGDPATGMMPRKEPRFGYLVNEYGETVETDVEAARRYLTAYAEFHGHPRASWFISCDSSTFCTVQGDRSTESTWTVNYYEDFLAARPSDHFISHGKTVREALENAGLLAKRVDDPTMPLPF